MIAKQKPILFLCVQRSVRAILAASILGSRVRGPWDIWITKVEVSPQEQDLASQVLDELGMVLISTPQMTEPSPGLVWEEGIVLSSGLADRCPIIPGAIQRRCWMVETPPSMQIALEQRLSVYRRIRDTLRSLIDEELLLPTLQRRYDR